MGCAEKAVRIHKQEGKDMSEKKYTLDLCEGSIVRKLLLFSLPLIASSVLQLLFNAVDVMVVGKFAGDNSLAAVGSNTPIINLIINVFMGLSIGTNVLTARYFAGKQEEELRKTVHTSIVVSVIGGLILLFIGGVASRQLLIWTQSPEEVIGLATVYLQIYFLGMPASMLYNFGAAILRGVGDTKRPLYYLSLSGILNLILNLIFVIVCKWDVVGVGIATVISQYLSAVLILRCLRRESEAIRLEWKKLRVDKRIFGQIMKIGLPAGIQSSMFSLSNVVVQSSINSFGAIAVAGNAAAQNIEGFMSTATKALSQATVAFVSQNMGAKKYDRINRIVASIMLATAGIECVCSFFIYVFGEPLLGLYTDSSEVIAQGMIRITIACVPHLIYGMMDVMAGALRGLGHSVIPMVVSLVGVCAFRVVWIACFFTNPAYRTIEIIYIAYPISWLIAFVVDAVCFVILRKKIKIS